MTPQNKCILILDSTQIDAFLTCPTQWNYGHRLRLTPGPGGDTKEAMLMGTFGHKLLERFYIHRSHGGSQSQAIDFALAFNADMETCECGKVKEDVIHTNDGYEPLFGEGLMELHTFKGKPYPLGMPERETVKQRFREYCYTYTNKDVTPISSEHVEVGFSHLLYEDACYKFILEGRMDIIAEFGGLTGWVDHKFQLRARNLYKKSIQFRNYSLVLMETLGILPIGMVNYIRLTKGVTKDTFHRDIAQFNRPELEAWKEKLIKLYFDVAKGLQEEKFEQNWASCSGKFGYPCDFTPLCEEIHESVRANKQNQLFSIREEWRPW